MKCIEINGKSWEGIKVVRVSDNTAYNKVSTGTAKYTSKEEWKKEGRHYA